MISSPIGGKKHNKSVDFYKSFISKLTILPYIGNNPVKNLELQQIDETMICQGVMFGFLNNLLAIGMC